MTSSSIISLMFGLCVAFIIAALVFKDSFRKDLTADQETTIKLGPLSVQGVLIIGLTTLLMIGALSPLIYAGWQLYNKPETAYACDSVINDLAKCKKSKTQLIRRDEIAKEVLKLNRDDEVSVDLRRIQSEQKGPWRRPQKSQDVVVSVPGNISKNQACPNYAKRDLTLGFGDQTLQLRIDIVSWDTDDCEEILTYGIKLTCATARELTGEDTISCKGKGANKFKIFVIVR